MPNRLRIIFMGTPEFAVPSLQSLVDNNSNVVAVITAPDKPAGRGQKMVASPVKIYAESRGIPVLQPEKLKNPEFLDTLRSFRADLQIVVAFRMLPEVVWSMPAFGTFNLHGSLLPQYRGAAPINWAVINGESETGVTTFFLEKDIDTGKIIFQDKETIGENDDAGAIYERLMHRGAALVVKTVKAIEDGHYPQIPQTEGGDLKAAPKIFRETCEISWEQPALQIHNFVRGLSPYPAAWTMLNGLSCKLFKTSIIPDNSSGQPGEYKTDNKTYLHFRAEDGWLAVETLQLEGKKRMQVDEFLRGTKL
ncbi:Methionyl-tRNA formyltransferase [Dyadobacter sp. CECT 9275]|uniref:Methionyl-tRNA formyltransferase n=1 Tax=Dyadobacter helix TaxID=2822344 RepID=A0A916N6H9_9BACT|nr:methionyl-tRNA formyltransferase [Dyadobacter sp. CECT 9275]CAG5003663.1 Methionyl-tRNA formyltransferase [Dyadobacter sp. CECT 9275]